MDFDLEDILEARQDAESLMADECTVQRPSTTGTTDPDSGAVTYPLTPIYPLQDDPGICRLKQGGGQGLGALAGGHEYTVQGFQVHFPTTAPPMQVDDLITLTRAAFDPSLLGTSFRITEVFRQSLASSRRVRVEELTS